jgi:large subunit ribosomal protein L4
VSPDHDVRNDVTVEVRDLGGGSAGTVDLDGAMFGVQPNVPVMHQVVTAQLAARRSGTQSTKTRSEVRGGGAKPWKQKGTGRARQGSSRAPHWTGGGVALGPKPRRYDQKTPKKMVRLALRSALSDRAASGEVLVVEAWAFTAPSTKQAVAALRQLGCSEGRTLLVLGENDEAAWKSFRNLGEAVHPILARELNAYDVLVSDRVVFSRETLPTAEPKAGVTPVSILSASAAMAGDALEPVLEVVGQAPVDATAPAEDDDVDEPNDTIEPDEAGASQ